MAPAPAEGRRRRDDEGRSRRALLLYFLAIVGPTLVLLGLGLQTAMRQRDAVAQLSEANRRLRETAVADAVERRLLADAHAALADQDLVSLVDATDWSHPRGVLGARDALDAFRAQHPIARHVFVIESGDVRLPRTEPPLPRRPDTVLAAEPPTSRAAMRRLLLEADALEHAGALRRASELYGRLHERALSDEVRAFALARLAACLDDTRDAQRKARAWATLAERYVDAYDLSGRPLALVAGVELARLGGAPGPGAVPLLDRVREELATGRWPLTMEEAEYFAGALGMPGEVALSPAFGDELRLGRELQAHFRHQGAAPSEGTVYAASLPDGTPLVYTVRGQRASTPLIVGIGVHEGWIRDHVLPGAALGTAADVELVSAGSGGTVLRSVLPALEVRVPAPRRAAGLDRGVLVFGGTTIVVLAVLLLGLVLLVRDVGRQAATSQVRANLVGGVSHELKTPLSVIRMYAETLADDPEPARADRHSYYEVIIHESVRLSHLIERVLDFSRVERGERQYVLATADLADLVARAAAQYAPYVRQQGFEFETAIEPLPPVRLDEEAVSQGLIALVENALRYSADERFLRVSTCARGAECVVQVEDRGVGIPAEERERIFRRFYRGSTPSGRGGYGLGLYLVRHMMDAHGGRIEVESEPGRGSLFRLVFPTAR
jgi:signal transduction histidine kinase